MKITCDACGAKYSIADEKVAGKAFKIKCKKCSSSIVVRAEQAAAPVQEQPSAEAQQWHVVVQGEQQGPLTTEKIGELITSGAIDWDAYVWQEGYDDWKSARDVPELVSALQMPDAAPAEQAAPVASVLASAGLFDSGEDDDGPTRAQAAHDIHEMVATAAQPKVSRASAAAGADLFAQAAKEEVASDSPFSGSAFSAGIGSAAAQASAKSRPTEESSGDNLTGTRNETSVLFSLSNLKQLKTSTPATKQASGATPGTARPAAGAATDDASGLIDIRALAAAASSTGTASAKQGQKDSDLAESILQSHQGTVPLAPLAAPSLRPESSGGANNRVLLIGFGIVGLLALVAIVLLVVFLTQKPEPTQTVATATAPVGATPTTPTTPGGAAQLAPGQAAPTTETTPGQPTAEGADEKSPREGSSKERSSSRRSSSSSKTTPEPEPKKSTGSIDDLLDQAIGTPGGSKTGGQTTSNLPDAPSRSDVTSAMRSVQGNVQSCGQGKTGVAQTSVSVSGSTGRVTSAQVGGAFAGTPTGRCIANAVKGARFPKFKRSSFSFVYPFRL